MMTATFVDLTATQKVTGTVALTVTDAVLQVDRRHRGDLQHHREGHHAGADGDGHLHRRNGRRSHQGGDLGFRQTTVATVSNTAASAGLVTAVARGSGLHFGHQHGPSVAGQPVVGTLAVTVNDGKLVSIAVTPATPSIAPGTKLQFVATGTFDDGAKQDITDSVKWASDTAAKVTIDGAGLATAVATGTAKITATQGTGTAAVSGSTTLTVTSSKLVSITLQPHPTASIANGTTVQFTAIGFFDDTTTQDLTDTATWASSATTIATISNAPVSNGLATGRARGTSNITASVLIGTSTVTSAPVTLTVTPATLMSIAITPANPSVAKGATLNLIATGTFTDGSTQVLTGDA